MWEHTGVQEGLSWWWSSCGPGWDIPRVDNTTGSVSDIAIIEILNVKPQGSKRHATVQWKLPFIRLETVTLFTHKNINKHKHINKDI